MHGEAVQLGVAPRGGIQKQLVALDALGRTPQDVADFTRGQMPEQRGILSGLNPAFQKLRPGQAAAAFPGALAPASSDSGSAAAMALRNTSVAFIGPPRASMIAPASRRVASG